MPAMKASIEASGVIPKSHIGLQRVLIGSDAVEQVAREVDSVAMPGAVVVVEDRTPMRRGADDLKEMVAGMLESRHQVRRVAVGPADGGVKASPETLREVRAATAGAGCVVAVGSGTITDIAKDASHHNEGLPLVVVQTAASVNGFSDDMAVLLKDGVKRTVPSAWPRSLIVDTRVLQDAPMELTRSGYAEMMAMFTAPVDWKAAGIFGMDDSYSDAIVGMFRDPEALLGSADALSRGEEGAVEVLAELLTRSGLAMAIAGRTAPLSGTEHMISHLIDMSAIPAGLRPGLHGAQVGVASVVVAALVDWLLDRLDETEPSAELPSPVAARSRVEVAFSRLDGSGAAAQECWADYSTKVASWDKVARSESLPARLRDVRELLTSVKTDVGAMVHALETVGAPLRFSQLDPPVDAERARWAVASSHLMRSRFGIADLAAFTGNWEEDDVEEVLDIASSLGGGL